MEKNLTTEQRAKLRKEFQTYLIDKHPELSDSTVSTIISDSFYTDNNNVGMVFWECFIDDKSMETARDKIQIYLLQEKQSDTASERALGYLYAMKHLKGFFDEHGGVNQCKSCMEDDVYLKTAFQNWMHCQRKSNG